MEVDGVGSAGGEWMGAGVSIVSEVASTMAFAVASTVVGETDSEVVLS